MKLLALILLVSSTAFALDFDYSAFHGTWQLIPEISHPECALNYKGPLTLFASAEDHTVIGKFDDGSQIEFLAIDQGRREFNSCFSDGILGYTETVGDGPKVTETTVYLKPGVMCMGGGEKRRTISAWEINGDSMVGSLRSRIIHMSPFEPRKKPPQKLCKFKRI